MTKDLSDTLVGITLIVLLIALIMTRHPDDHNYEIHYNSTIYKTNHVDFHPKRIEFTTIDGTDVSLPDAGSTIIRIWRD